MVDLVFIAATLREENVYYSELKTMIRSLAQAQALRALNVVSSPFFNFVSTPAEGLAQNFGKNHRSTDEINVFIASGS